jgi:hypothetical protein
MLFIQEMSVLNFVHVYRIILSLVDWEMVPLKCQISSTIFPTGRSQIPQFIYKLYKPTSVIFSLLIKLTQVRDIFLVDLVFMAK